MFNMNNPFLDSMKSCMNPDLFANSMKNMPTLDFSSFSNMSKKNAEIMTATNQMAAESVQSIMRRGAEIFQENVSEVMNTVKHAMGSNNLEQAATHGQQYMKSALENSVNNAKEMLDMVSKSSQEIFETIGKNITENVSATFDHTKKSL